MIFGQLTAVGLWNLAKYLVVTTFFHYDLRYSEIKWWQLNIWPKLKVQGAYISPKSFNWNEIQTWSVTHHYTLTYLFGMWVYNDKLQIKFTFSSGPMIFGQVMALGLWNLAKYLVVTTFVHYDLRYWLDFWYVSASKKSGNN
jgi:hypothetical protein